jgi:hypothetical protein
MVWQANCFMGIESNFAKPMCFEGLPAGVASGAGIAAVSDHYQHAGSSADILFSELDARDVVLKY